MGIGARVDVLLQEMVTFMELSVELYLEKSRGAARRWCSYGQRVQCDVRDGWGMRGGVRPFVGHLYDNV